MKSPKNLLESTRRFRKTPKGILTNMYQHIKSRSIHYGMQLDFDLAYLHQRFLNDKKYLSLVKQWKIGGFKYYDKPSLDRKNPDDGYTKKNIQMLTWRENRKKGERESKRHTTAILVYDLNGWLIDNLESVKDTVNKYKVNQGLLTSVCQGRRNHTGGYVFKYRGDKFKGNFHIGNIYEGEPCGTSKR